MLFLKKIISWILFIKCNNRVFFEPHVNCINDKYDLINYHSDNCLCLINVFLEKYRGKKLIFYVAQTSNRVDLIKKYISSFNNKCIDIKMVREDTFFWKIMSFFKKMTCKTLISSSPCNGFAAKTRFQKVIVLSYSTPLKIGNINCKKNTYEYINYFVETSDLTGVYHSVQLKYNHYKVSKPLGFLRNDFLLKNNNYKKIDDWIQKKVNYVPKHIFVYAPTYRDYQGAYNSKCCLGYEDNKILETFLEETDSVLIYKMHPLQETSAFSESKRIIKYENTYDFSLYDLLYKADCLVSDYSSVIHDFMLTHKPILINTFDYDKYLTTRGFALNPVESFLPSNGISSLKNLINEMNKVIIGEYDYSKYDYILELFHKNRHDFSSLNYDFVCKCIWKM